MTEWLTLAFTFTDFRLWGFILQPTDGTHFWWILHIESATLAYTSGERNKGIRILMPRIMMWEVAGQWCHFKKWNVGGKYPHEFKKIVIEMVSKAMGMDKTAKVPCAAWKKGLRRRPEVSKFQGVSSGRESLDEGKKESEKAGLKLNIQKTKIMASGPISSWQIDGEQVETVTDFIFLSSKITADGNCSHKIKIYFLLWRQAMARLDSILKSRDIILLTKIHIVRAIVFCSHVWM